MGASKVGQRPFCVNARLSRPTRDRRHFCRGAALGKVGQVGQRWDKGGTWIFVYYTVFLVPCPTLRGVSTLFHTCGGDNRHCTSWRSGTSNVCRHQCVTKWRKKGGTGGTGHHLSRRSRKKSCPTLVLPVPPCITYPVTDANRRWDRA